MMNQDARKLIHEAFHKINNSQIWADLGCGDGFFTNVLGSLLPAGSLIYAVDKLCQHIISLPEVSIEFIKGDFRSELHSIPPLNGIMMANSLHYINDKASLLKKLLLKLKSHGRLVIIEYELITGNPWVPYPINFEKLKALLEGLDFVDIKKLGEQTSMYRQHMMYACAATLK